MKNLLAIICLCMLVPTNTIAQNYIQNGGKLKVLLIAVKEIPGGVEDTRNSYLAEFSYSELKFLGLVKRVVYSIFLNPSA